MTCYFTNLFSLHSSCQLCWWVKLVKLVNPGAASCQSRPGGSLSMWLGHPMWWTSRCLGRFPWESRTNKLKQKSRESRDLDRRKFTNLPFKNQTNHDIHVHLDFQQLWHYFILKKNDVSLILRHLKFKDTSMVAVNGSLFLFSGVLVDVCNDFLHPALISPSGSFSRWKSEEWQFPSWSWQRKTWTWENQAKTKHNKWSETGADYELREGKRWDYWWNVACTWRCIPDEAWKMGHHFLTRISSWRKSMEGSWFLPQTGRSCPRKEES